MEDEHGVEVLIILEIEEILIFGEKKSGDSPKK